MTSRPPLVPIFPTDDTTQAEREWLRSLVAAEELPGEVFKPGAIVGQTLRTFMNPASGHPVIAASTPTGEQYFTVIPSSLPKGTPPLAEVILREGRPVLLRTRAGKLYLAPTALDEDVLRWRPAVEENVYACAHLVQLLLGDISAPAPARTDSLYADVPAKFLDLFRPGHEVRRLLNLPILKKALAS